MAQMKIPFTVSEQVVSGLDGVGTGGQLALWTDEDSMTATSLVDVTGGDVNLGEDVLFLDVSAGSIGLNTTSPAGKVHVVQSGTMQPILYDTYDNTSAPGVTGRRALGSLGTPAQVTVDNVLVQMSCRPWRSDSAAFATGNSGAVRLVASESITNAARGTYVSFQATPTGTNTIAEVLRIMGLANMGLGGVTSFGTNATKTFAALIGVAPASSPADTAQQYVNDHDGAGTATWFFRNEEGHIFKLVQATALTAEDEGVVDSGDETTDGVIENLRTRIAELEAALVAAGIVASS